MTGYESTSWRATPGRWRGGEAVGAVDGLLEDGLGVTGISERHVVVWRRMELARVEIGIGGPIRRGVVGGGLESNSGPHPALSGQERRGLMIGRVVEVP